MVTRIGKITIGAGLIALASYMWKVALLVLIIGFCVRLYNINKNKNKSEKWD